jgi:hypothetical protein
MDRVIAHYPARLSGADLSICDYPGLAYQTDMRKSVPYDDAYFDKYTVYRDLEIFTKLQEARINTVERLNPYTVIDIGIGDGAFLEALDQRRHAQFEATKVPGLVLYGYDVNAKAKAWLEERRMWLDIYTHLPPKGVVAWTLWDVLEHIPEPHLLFDRIRPGDYLVTSIPIFKNLDRIRESKHYRPNEHYYYFTDDGLRSWLRRYDLVCRVHHRLEAAAGREDIETYVFQKVGERN